MPPQERDRSRRRRGPRGRNPNRPSQISRRERGLPVEQERGRSSGRGGERIDREREARETGGRGRGYDSRAGTRDIGASEVSAIGPIAIDAIGAVLRETIEEDLVQSVLCIAHCRPGNHGIPHRDIRKLGRLDCLHDNRQNRRLRRPRQPEVGSVILTSPRPKTRSRGRRPRRRQRDQLRFSQWILVESAPRS